jgi:hypothetical protein
VRGEPERAAGDQQRLELRGRPACEGSRPSPPRSGAPGRAGGGGSRRVPPPGDRATGPLPIPARVRRAGPRRRRARPAAGLPAGARPTDTGRWG